MKTFKNTTKTVIMTLLVTLVFTLGSSVTYASESQEYDIKEVHTKIVKIYFEPDSGYYIAHTKKDKNGRFWVLYLTGVIISTENKELTKQINKSYLNKNITIVTSEPLNSDEETEILNVWVTK